MKRRLTAEMRDDFLDKYDNLRGRIHAILTSQPATITERAEFLQKALDEMEESVALLFKTPEMGSLPNEASGRIGGEGQDEDPEPVRPSL